MKILHKLVGRTKCLFGKHDYEMQYCDMVLCNHCWKNHPEEVGEVHKEVGGEEMTTIKKACGLLIITVLVALVALVISGAITLIWSNFGPFVAGLAAPVILILLCLIAAKTLL